VTSASRSEEGRSPGEPSANQFLAAVRSARRRPLLIAHRGDSAHAPENTLDAARRAWEAGADAWEFDVQLTRDGVAVVIHDESLDRTTDVARRFRADPRAASGYLVADFDFDEVRTLDAGSWFHSRRADSKTARALETGEVRVPSLRECLELTRRLDWLANVELKALPDPDPRLLDAVIAELDAVGCDERVLISSFDHDEVARAARTSRGWATGVLAATPIHRPAKYVREIVGADCFHTSTLCLGAGSSRYLRHPAPEHLRTGDLRTLAESGIPALVYTVNDARPDGLAAHLAGTGVAGLFTDDPGALRGLVDNSP
jgi:glycerophosphoryl diester phosphodiesterase